MTSGWRAGWLILAGLLVVAASALRAAEPQPGAVTEATKGELLIASAQIRDPRFYHAVVLMIRHDAKGAFGIVINRPIAERPIKTLLAAADKKPQPGDKTIKGQIWVYAGGPVQRQFGFVVHSTDYRTKGTVEIDGKVAMTANVQILRDIGHRKGPKKRFFAFGYAGWGPGQIEGEIARHDWFTAPDDPALVFDADRSTVWRQALEQRLRQL